MSKGSEGEGQLLVKLGVMLGGQIGVSFVSAERKGRGHAVRTVRGEITKPRCETDVQPQDVQNRHLARPQRVRAQGVRLSTLRV